MRRPKNSQNGSKIENKLSLRFFGTPCSCFCCCCCCCCCCFCFFVGVVVVVVLAVVLVVSPSTIARSPCSKERVAKTKIKWINEKADLRS